jgi:pyruvate,water dikinase
MCALPGVSGEEVDRDLLGYVADGVVDEPYPWRGPFVALKAPRELLRTGREARELRGRLQPWWQQRVGSDGLRPGVDARAAFTEALAEFAAAMRVQAKARMMFQAASSQLVALAQRAGMSDAAGSLMAGRADLEEAAVADDLWLTAHRRLALDEFVARHGFHGPNSGDITTRSWREDRRPLERLLDVIGQAKRPAERRARTRAESERIVGELVASLPPRERLGARIALRLAPAAARNLELAKTAHLIALDVARATARAIGDGLAADGFLSASEDVFLLLRDELLDGALSSFHDLTAERREARQRHAAVEIPKTWTGQPEAIPAATEELEATTRVMGVGVSAGVADGTVKVVLDAGELIDLELGDILVAPTTDPSWMSLMLVAGALVIDVGTTASHGAIVARELGVPCVIGTEVGTKTLRTGDRVRVDGATGVVDVLARVAGAAPTG